MDPADRNEEEGAMRTIRLVLLIALVLASTTLPALPTGTGV